MPLWRWPGRGAGIIAFSHGAASAPWKYPGLTGPWSAAGYEIIAPLHADSPDHPDHATISGLATWKARIEDMRTVSNHIGGPYIAAGHSYGALTALVLGGARANRPDGISEPLRDTAARCVVAFSPPGPIPGLIESAGYAQLGVPALIETGTRDVPQNASDTVNGWRTHLAAFDAATVENHRYSLILQGVDHYFGGAICDFSQPGPPKTFELNLAAQIALAFMGDWGSLPPNSQSRLVPYLTAEGPARLSVK